MSSIGGIAYLIIGNCITILRKLSLSSFRYTQHLMTCRLYSSVQMLDLVLLERSG